MVVRDRFEVMSFINSWPGEATPPNVLEMVEQAGEQIKLGLATLTLVSTRREYWAALGCIAGYAGADGESVHAVVQQLAPDGQPLEARLEGFGEWVRRSEDVPRTAKGEIVPATQILTSVFRAEAIAAAADVGQLYQVCWRRYEPDWGRVWACVSGRLRH